MTTATEQLTGWHVRGRTTHGRRECLRGPHARLVSLDSPDFVDWIPCPRCGAGLVHAAERASAEAKALTVLATYPVDDSTERWLAARKPVEVAFLTELAALFGTQVVAVAGGKFPITALAVDAGAEIVRRCSDLFQVLVVDDATAQSASPSRIRLFLTLAGAEGGDHARAKRLWAAAGDCL